MIMEKKEIEPGIFFTSYHCIWYEPKRTVLLSDLHLGYEACLTDQGVSIPRYQKEEILDRLSTILNRFDPESMVVIGDFKHEFGKNRDQEFRDVYEVMDLLNSKVNLAVVRGNHDNFLKTITNNIGIPLYEWELKMDDIVLSHGHKKVEHEDLLIMGHEHPSLKIRDEVGAVLKRPCFLYDEKERVMILPAISPLAQGRDMIASEGFISTAIEDLNPDGFRAYMVSSDGLIDFQTLAEVKRAIPDLS